MGAALSTRVATTADIPFLAKIEYEASLPPLNHCYWEDILDGTGTSALPFIEAKLRANASNWGNVTDFSILEAQGKPVAAAAGYVPNQKDYCPLDLSRLDRVAHELTWSDEVTKAFHHRYLDYFGGDLQPAFFAPQATWIVENVAVIPEARGQGFGKALLKALIENGRSQQHTHAGIMIINGNDAARHTYESVGFKAYQTFHSGYFSEQFDIDFPGITKFGFRLN